MNNDNPQESESSATQTTLVSYLTRNDYLYTQEYVNTLTEEEASEAYKKIKELENRLELEKKEVTKPINEALAVIRKRYKPAEEVIAVTTGYIKTRLIELKKARDEAQAKQLNLIEKPAIVTKYKNIQRLKITDESLIPRVLMVPDEKAILERLKNGVAVPGCELITETIVSL